MLIRGVWQREDSRELKRALCGAALTVLLFAAALAGGCGGGGPDTSGPEYGPVVPGYSLAWVNIDSTPAEVSEVLGGPDETRSGDGYIHAFYGRIAEGGEQDAPGAWNYVVVFQDDGDGEPGEGDRVGQVEASAPYHGTTVNGNGLESTPRDFFNELGECDGVSRAEYGGQTYVTYVFSRRGFAFVARGEGEDAEIVTLMVTSRGGLAPSRRKGKEYREAVGDIFRATKTEPVLPGSACAGIGIGDNFLWVKELYGLPNLSGSLGEGLVFASYTGGTGSWKLNLYLEDTDGDGKPGDYDAVISVGVRSPYAGKTPKGTGIGSRQGDVIKEFGPPEFEDQRIIGGESINIWQYPSRGVVFAITAASGEVVEIDVNRI